MPKFKVNVTRTAYREGEFEIEIDHKDWENMTEEQRAALIEKAALHEAGNHPFTAGDHTSDYSINGWYEVPKKLHKVEIRHYAGSYGEPAFATEVVEIEAYDGDTGRIWREVKRMADDSKYADARIPDWHFKYDVLESTPLEEVNNG